MKFTPSDGVALSHCSFYDWYLIARAAKLTPGQQFCVRKHIHIFFLYDGKTRNNIPCYRMRTMVIPVRSLHPSRAMCRTVQMSPTGLVKLCTNMSALSLLSFKRSFHLITLDNWTTENVVQTCQATIGCIFGLILVGSKMSDPCPRKRPGMR
jgi:hypothetical protein